MCVVGHESQLVLIRFLSVKLVRPASSRCVKMCIKQVHKAGASSRCIKMCHQVGASRSVIKHVHQAGASRRCVNSQSAIKQVRQLAECHQAGASRCAVKML